jgi:aryl-alcohol dehydrogenase-like predicted oxidoreductase
MPQIPGTDLTVSSLCLGGNVFGWTADDATSRAVLDRYVDATPSTVSPFVDTAESYGDGASEQILGRWLRSHGQRDRVVVATKASRHNKAASAVGDGDPYRRREVAAQPAGGGDRSLLRAPR